MIPKIIHYCWLSDDPVPPDYLEYRKLWEIKLPDYQFMLWDKKRFDLNKTTWTRQAFDTRMYACAADYIRFFAVYNHGGIYLDMDMEIIKPFDDLLNADLMIAYESHISENLEAGCFGAAKCHEYIKKCMEYFEVNNFFDGADTEKILKMAVSNRINYINPPTATEIMKNTLKYFIDKEYIIYPSEYFTAKNIVTGIIEKTENTYTVHHFATQYHSDKWRKNRETEQKISVFFGGNKKLSKIVIGGRRAVQRVMRYGLIAALRYYIERYILRKRNREEIDI
jgi:mannosyltransferase OCH1-like enzyme